MREWIAISTLMFKRDHDGIHYRRWRNQRECGIAGLLQRRSWKAAWADPSGSQVALESSGADPSLRTGTVGNRCVGEAQVRDGVLVGEWVAIRTRQLRGVSWGMEFQPKKRHSEAEHELTAESFKNFGVRPRNRLRCMVGGKIRVGS